MTFIHILQRVITANNNLNNLHDQNSSMVIFVWKCLGTSRLKHVFEQLLALSTVFVCFKWDKCLYFFWAEMACASSFFSNRLVKNNIAVALDINPSLQNNCIFYCLLRTYSQIIYATWWKRVSYLTFLCGLVVKFPQLTLLLFFFGAE